MPKMVVVNLVDEDGDEFPFAFPGTRVEGDEDALEEMARERAAEFVAAGDMRPTGELTLGSIEPTL